MGINAAESLTKLKEFTGGSLKWCAEESESSTSKITDSVDILLKKTARVSQLSEESLQAIEEFKSDLDDKIKNSECNLSDLVSNLKKLTQENAEAKAIISPIIEELQFQDRLRQNLENIVHTVDVYLEARGKVETAGGFSEELKKEFGNKTCGKMTMKSERDIIRGYIDGLDEEKEQESVQFF